MTPPEPQFIEVGTGAARRRIAVIAEQRGEPGLLWLSGFNSEMTSTKASHLAELAAARGLSMTRFDYSGHGQSGGAFQDGTLSRWLEEAVEVFRHCTSGRQIVIGSSMGGHIALLLLRELQRRDAVAAGRLAALLLIAPAWNMTEDLIWRELPAAAREAIVREGVWLRPSEYGDPYPITRALIEDGRGHLLDGAPWDPGRPVHIVHGRLDPDVPFAHGEALFALLPERWRRFTAIEDGEHRLSRPQDLAVIDEVLEELIARV